jgi:transketolase
VLSENRPTKLLKIGMPDAFAESGSHRELWKKYGLDRTIMLPKIEAWLELV